MTNVITHKITMETHFFIAKFSQNEHVKQFSDEAVEAILEQYQQVMNKSDNPMSVNWEPLFMDAGEMDAAGVVYAYKNDIGYHAEAIIKMARTKKIGAGTELGECLDDTLHPLSDLELLNFLMPQLMTLPEYNDGVAEILAKEYDFKKLSNGNYIILGAY